MLLVELEVHQDPGTIQVSHVDVVEQGFQLSSDTFPRTLTAALGAEQPGFKQVSKWDANIAT